jgi:hypothetical protein
MNTTFAHLFARALHTIKVSILVSLLAVAFPITGYAIVWSWINNRDGAIDATMQFAAANLSFAGMCLGTVMVAVLIMSIDSAQVAGRATANFFDRH